MAALQQNAQATADEVVRVVDISKRFGRLAAVDRLSLSIKAGEIFGLIGPNGAGKSTLAKMLTTLVPPSSGSASVAGYDIVRQPRDVRRRIGYVPQTLSADGALSGVENMMLSAGLYGVPLSQQKRRVGELLATMGLLDVAGRLAGKYSGGLLRRLEIGQSVLHRPAVLFMDEPTVGLDPSARRSVWTHLLGLRRTYGATMHVTTHYMEEAEEYCDRIAMIANGRIAAMGTPAELKAKIGADATLEDAFERLVGAKSRGEFEIGYDRAGEDRRASQQHG